MGDVLFLESIHSEHYPNDPMIFFFLDIIRFLDKTEFCALNKRIVKTVFTSALVE